MEDEECVAEYVPDVGLVHALLAAPHCYPQDRLLQEGKSLK